MLPVFASLDTSLSSLHLTSSSFHLTSGPSSLGCETSPTENLLSLRRYQCPGLLLAPGTPAVRNKIYKLIHEANPRSSL